MASFLISPSRAEMLMGSVALCSPPKQSFHFQSPYSSLLPSHFKPYNPFHFPSSFNPTLQYPSPPSKFLSKTLIKPINSIPSNPFPSFSDVRPYILAQHNLILLGWLCSLLSVVSLAHLVPRIGQFSSAIVKLDGVRLRNEGLLIVALFWAKLVATYGQHALLWKAALNAGYKIRVDVFEGVLQRELGFFEGDGGVSSGDIAYRITTEAADVADTLHVLLNTIVPSAVQLSAMTGQMLAVSPVLCLISAMVIPCMALAIVYLGERLRKISKKAHLSIATLSAYLNEDVGKAYNEWKQGEPAIERLFGLARSKSKEIDKPGAIALDYVTGDIKFCDVSFKYDESRPHILKGLNLHIKAGETIALVGPSGGGKTTLVKLLLRLYDSYSGHILVDNCDIQNIKLETLRRHIGLVSQDIALFSRTVAENIGYRDLTTEIDMDKVEMAAKIANAVQFIKPLSNGYQTNVGPRGSSLSGGQKQRLCIARAVYQDSPVLILDEATSALDSQSESLVREALHRLMEDRTVIVIAHRLETALMAKRVFVLDDGKLQELTDPSHLLQVQTNSFASSGLVIWTVLE